MLKDFFMLAANGKRSEKASGGVEAEQERRRQCRFFLPFLSIRSVFEEARKKLVSLLRDFEESVCDYAVGR
jgi:hypothetical protein